MGIDIKLPIGLMFTLLGLFLTIYGFATISNSQLYLRSLGININLISGIIMLIFGILMLVSSKRKKQS